MKRRRGSLALLVPLVLCASSLAMSLFAYENTCLSSWSFEEDLEGWNAEGASVLRSAYNPSDGRYSLRIIPEMLVGWGIERTFGPAGAGCDAIAFDVITPPSSQAGIRPIVYLKDKDGIWFQAMEDPLEAGKWRRIEVDVSPESADLRPKGHFARWGANRYRKACVLGISFFSENGKLSDVYVDNIVCHAAEQPKLRAYNLHVNRSRTPCYGGFEVTFDLNHKLDNPFDPDEISVEAEFSAPSGRISKVYGFYYQEYQRTRAGQREILRPAGRGSWKIRFGPREVGEYSYSFKVITQSGKLQSPAYRFTATASDNPGFVRVSTEDPRYFEFDDGTFFYPIGQNIHAPFDKRTAEKLRLPMLPDRGTYAYDYYFKKMAENGENLCCIWICNWWCSIEWSKRWKYYGGLGDYNLRNAWRIDHLLDLAEKHKIYVHLVVDNHGKLSKWVDPEWETNPYNTANDGPVHAPEAFFGSPDTVEKHYLRKLRYILARWGHSPRLFGLELWGELNLTGSNKRFIKHPAKAQWHRHIVPKIKALDAYGHLLTSHYSSDWKAVDPKVASLPQIDYVVGDSYKAGGCVIPLILKTAEENGRFGKPTFSTEFGGNWDATTPRRLKADLHAGIWSNWMTHSAGTPLFWWFDFVDREDLYCQYRSFSNYARGEDKRGRKGSTISIEIVGTEEEKGKLAGVGLIGDDGGYVYVWDKLAAEVFPDKHHARRHSGCVAGPISVSAGDYNIEYWDTMEGNVMVTEQIATSDRRLLLTLPSFKISLAAKIVHAGVRR